MKTTGGLRRLGWTVGLAAVLALGSRGDDLDDMLEREGDDEPKDSPLAELAKDMGGGTLFRFAPVERPEEPLEGRLYWREYNKYLAVQTAPVRLLLDGKEVIAPRTVQNPRTMELSQEYPVAGRKLVPAAAEHVLMPGNLRLKYEGKLLADHPALRVVGDEVRILCAPVRLEAMDPEGRPVPAKLRVSWENTGLLREEGSFNPLIVWLPVGCAYKSSLGGFRLTAEGKLETVPGDLAAGVVQTAEGLRLTVPAKEAPAVAAAPAVDATRLWLFAHRGRRVYAWDETAVWTVVVPRGAGGEARVLCAPRGAAGAKPLALGTVALPAVSAATYDSRLFELRMAALPPGAYDLWLECGAARSRPEPVEVVPEFDRSPFFVHSHSACIDLWPTTEDGLAALRRAALEMGGDVTLDVGMPGLQAARLAALRKDPAQGPPELALVRSANDELLERLLRHQVRSTELIVCRAAGFYMEGLSYHHSYKPSVDRMIRHLQVFAQQTADYPSYWGVNYSWFPALFGYAEGGVPTDAHVGDRNEALAASLAQAGYTNAPRELRDWYQKNKFSTEPAERAKADAIRRQIVRYWKAQMDFGFGRHNRLYNDAVRAVRPDLACTLFENAGHDAMKRTRSLYNDMAASGYESYTDFGEWAMSASFTTDWALGNRPGEPVWITTDWGTTSEGMMKSLFHAFGRGLAGGGAIMAASSGLGEIERRGKGQRFVSQYGAIARRATPDRRFAILVTDAHQVFDGRAPYIYHAVYYHLTRLGCPPVLLDEPTVTEQGIPEGVRALVLVREQDPLEPGVEKALAAFRQRGGTVAVTRDCLVKPEGAVTIAADARHIWELGGFGWSTHAAMWDEFETNWRAPLRQALAALGVPAAATTDPDQGLVVTLDAGAVRYAVVIADKRSTHFSVFEPTEGLPVSFEGAGWTVRDLAKQATLAAEEKDGRTLVKVDLVTEPTTVLALYRNAPAGVTVEAVTAPVLGGTLAFRGTVAATERGDMGPVPVTCTVLDPAGQERLSVHRAAGDTVEYPLAAFDAPGAWTVKVQELLTGLTATAALNVAPAASVSSVVPVPEVHVVNPALVRQVAARPGEKLVIVEPGRNDLLPLARKLAAGLTAAGVAARVWEVRPEDFATIPVRYYSRPSETNELALIDAGRLIGFRENLKPFIDTKARANVPERGGYAEIEPYFMVGRDCILFSGGPLAESLRAVTPWLNTPTVPGRGQGRITPVLSPFMADRHVLTVVGNDAEGMARAADRLVALVAQKAGADAGPAAAAGELKAVAASVAAAPVAQPYLVYTPLRRVQRLLANADGRAAVLLAGRKDNLALVDAAGQVSGTVALPEVSAPSLSLDAQGRVWNYVYDTRVEKGPATVTAQCVRPDGTLEGEWLVYEGDPDRLGPHGAVAAFPVAPDGRTAAFGRLGGLLLGDLAANRLTLYDDAPWVKKTFEVWTPRFPVAMAFSPDSRYLFFTMDTRPTGYENMHQSLNFPEGSESVLLEAATGKRVWALRGRPAEYATYNGFAAVAEDGVATAFVDVFGTGYVIGKDGKPVFKAPLEPTTWYNGSVTAPRNAVGTWIAANGKLALFGFKGFAVLAEGAGRARVEGTNLCAGAVSRDGAFAVTAWDDGALRAYSPAGERLWSATPGGVGPRVAALPDGQTLVGTSEGELVWLDRKGAELRRTKVAEAVDRERHPLARAAGAAPHRLPPVYRDPGTLAVAVARLGAKKDAEWKAAGAGHEVAGRTFYALGEKAELAGPESGEAFVHLVYRRPPENKSLKVVILTGPRREEFVLDKPAPDGRVVDIPFRGPNAKVVVEANGPAEAAELSVWRFAWPGQNVAYVKPPDTGGGGMELLGDGGHKDEGGGMELDIEEDGGGTFGRMKETATWSPNPDIDKVAGPWLTPPVNGLLVVNGGRFDTGAWNEGKKFVGEWLTQKFGSAAQLSLAATYDHSRKQSGVTENLAVFQNDLGGARAQGGDVLGAALDNDQFWRLFSFPPTKVSLLGVYVYTSGPGPEGLSELEAYR